MTRIENTLYQLWTTAEFNYSSWEEKQAQVDAYNSIAWYCNTGRSSAAFDKALGKANPKKLLAAIICGDNTVDAQILSAKGYLAQYCGLR